MQAVPKLIFLMAGALAAAPFAPQEPPAQKESRGLPPRATPGDYQSHADAGAVTLAAEFDGHFVPLPEGTLSTDDFVVVEVALFGKPGARATLSPDEFSLRINGKKSPVSSEPYVLVGDSLKDPSAEPPSSAAKSKTSIGGGGQPGDNAPPAPVKIPLEKRRAMTEHLQKASLAEGDRALPQAGLIYFPYKGKSKGIHSLELIYNGASGEATVPLQP